MLEVFGQPHDEGPGRPDAGCVPWAPLRLRRPDGEELALRAGNTVVMGILNLTPDSFSDGGKYLDPEQAVARAREMVAQGAQILDIGAESTRPGAQEVSPLQEWQRLEPVLRRLGTSGIRAVLSVDTRHLFVAAAAAASGVSLLNLPFPQDLPAGSAPAEVREVLGRFDGIVLMHSRGTPGTMGDLCDYAGSLCGAVAAELRATARLLGLLPEGPLWQRVVFDPGLGFAKKAPQSLLLLSQVDLLQRLLLRPVLVGASRKSFLGKATGLQVAKRLVPSVVAAVLAAQQGAAVVRVHDVAETRAGLALLSAVQEAGGRA